MKYHLITAKRSGKQVLLGLYDNNTKARSDASNSSILESLSVMGIIKDIEIRTINSEDIDDLDSVIEEIKESGNLNKICYFHSKDEPSTL